MVLFLLVAMLVFAIHLKRSFKSTRGFCSFQEVYGGRLVFSSGRVFMCFMCTPLSPLMGRIFDHLFLSMSNLKESRWVQLCYYNSLAHDASHSFGGHHCCFALAAPPSFKPCPSTYFWLSTWTHLCLGLENYISMWGHYGFRIVGVFLRPLSEVLGLISNILWGYRPFLYGGLCPICFTNELGL